MLNIEPNTKAYCAKDPSQRRVLTKLQAALSKKDQEIVDEVKKATKQLAKEFNTQARETKEEMQLILANQADQHKDEIMTYEAQLEAFRTKIR